MGDSEHTIREAIYEEIEYYEKEKPSGWKPDNYHMRVLSYRIYSAMVRAGWIKKAQSTRN